MTLRFVKMHGAANDFVVLDHREPFLPADPGGLVRALCDRRRGVGADGVLLLERDPEHDFAMRYFNSDGGVADFCGNGARCLARFALGLGLGRAGAVRFRTAVGVLEARETAGGHAIDLHFGRVGRAAEPVTLETPDGEVRGRRVLAGVPHLVIAVAQVGDVDLPDRAPPLRRHPRLGPGGANVDFVARLAPGLWAMRTWERGVEAETLACGSGAIATAVFAAAEGDTPPVRVRTRGGDVLEVALAPVDDAWDVRLIGPAATAFTGEWPGTTS